MKFFTVVFILLLPNLKAHVGSPDVFFEGKAGPYPVSIAIRPPTVIPGVAEVEVHTAAQGVHSIHVVPFPLVGIGSKYPPTADLAKRSTADPQFYNSSVWLMAFGSYQVQVDVQGTLGQGTVSVPVPSIASETKAMTRGLGVILLLLMIVIVIGAISIAGAAVRESTLPEGELPDRVRRRLSRFVITATIAAVIAILALGNWWWGVEASNYRAYVYKAPVMDASMETGALHLRIQESRWAIRPKLDTYLPDHGHLMHLFVVRMPEMDRMWHLHPDLISNREFTQAMPSLVAGHYKLFADVVHASGFPETPVADFDLPLPVQGKVLTGDDAAGVSPPLSAFDPGRASFVLPDGHRMVRLYMERNLVAKQMEHLVFEVRDSAGQPATDLEPYMGMAGHAEILSTDASVFAHVHPSGTVPMSALALTAEGKRMPVNHVMHHAASIPARLAFPYGFPKAGRYRIFVQVQRAGSPQTAAFDLEIRSPKL